MCDCAKDMDERLKELNGRLVGGFSWNPEGRVAILPPVIAVEKIAPRGKKPPTLIATYCPFCGVRCEDVGAPVPSRPTQGA